MVRSINSIINPFAKPLSVSVWVFLSVMVINSCDSIQSSLEVSNTNSAVAVQITKVSPMSAKPNETLSLSGTGFNTVKNPTIRLTMSDGSVKKTSVLVTSSTAASFVMPEGMGLGLKSATLMSGSTKEVTSFKLVADQISNDLPIIIDEQSEICTTKKYIDRNGETQTGTKDCSAQSAKPCAVDGDSNCLVDGSTYKAAAINNLSAGNIKFGVTIAGVSGNAAVESHSNCASNRATGCVTTDTYQSANLTNLSAGNIKSGITIAGQLGDYPSVTYKLPRAEGATADLADLDNATFDAKVKSQTAFEYWTSAGSYQTGAGDADITQANIKDTVSIFGTVGNLTAAVAPNSWDVRVGVTVNGVTGKLKVNCRNRVNSIYFNYDGAISGIGQSAPLTPGTAIDIWDTIDDKNNNDVSGLPPPSIVTAWVSSNTSNTDCGGVETTAGDANVWKDVTTAGTGRAACEANSEGSPGSPENCTMQDKITGLWWSKMQTAATWNTAWSTCLTTLNGTTYGTNSVPGYNAQTGWRLPTQKELMDAYNHGIRSAASSNWITLSQVGGTHFWSGSSVSSSPSSAWYVDLANGGTYNNAKNRAYLVVCVR